MGKLYDTIGKIELFLAKSSLAVLSLLVFCAAVARTLHHPINWAVDAATFLFAWCVFLSADIAMRQDKLVTIDVVVKRLPKKVQFTIQLINQFIIIIFLAALIVFGVWLSYTTRYRTFQGIPGFSYTWVTLSVPVGSLLMLVTTVLKVRDQIRRGFEQIQNTASGKEIL